MVDLLGALFGGLGLLVVVFGGLNLQKWQTMRSMDPAGATAIDEGLQELEGVARSVGETVTSPFTETESLVCEYKVESYTVDDDIDGSGDDWNIVKNETLSVPFEVECGGETVVVDPENAEHLLSNKLRLDTRSGDENPPGVQAYLEGGDTVELGPVELDSRGGRHRFTEKRVDEGDDVYVLGPAERDSSAVPDGSDARVVIGASERGFKEEVIGDPFIVSDSGEEQAEKRQLKRSLFMLVLGAGFIGFALFTMFG